MQNQESVDKSRRSLLKKAYVAPTVIALGTMITPNTGNASSSLCVDHHRDNGWGNGDDRAPGRSIHHNNAENNDGSWWHRLFGQPHQD